MPDRTSDGLRAGNLRRARAVIACLSGAAVLAVLLPAARVHAADVVIYRCTDVFGHLTVQNDTPCPKGTRQKKQVIQPPPPMPAYRPVERPPEPVAAATPAPIATADVPAPAATPPIADADRLPPPPIFQCNTYDHDSYLSENATPEPRCVRLDVTDVDGTGNAGEGVACQMVTDQCQRVPDGAACDAWTRRGRETEAAWKFSAADSAPANQREYERVQKILRDSTCGR
jgi:hypothetical protein